MQFAGYIGVTVPVTATPQNLLTLVKTALGLTSPLYSLQLSAVRAMTLQVDASSAGNIYGGDSALNVGALRCSWQLPQFGSKSYVSNIGDIPLANLWVATASGAGVLNVEIY